MVRERSVGRREVYGDVVKELKGKGWEEIRVK